MFLICQHTVIPHFPSSHCRFHYCRSVLDLILNCVALCNIFHFQELNRLIRDNDRLQRIIVRHGGAELFRSVGGSSDLLSSPLGGAGGGVNDSRMSDMSFENAAQSPGMTFRDAPFTSAASSALGAARTSKSPLYSSKIRGSLTPPGKFLGRSPDKASYVASNGADRASRRSNGGGGGSGSSGSSGEQTDRRSVNFSGQDHVHHLSDKYAPSPDGGSTGTAAGAGVVGGDRDASNLRVPESPPPPPRQNLANVLNWGALNESLSRQVRSQAIDINPTRFLRHETGSHS